MSEISVYTYVYTQRRDGNLLFSVFELRYDIDWPLCVVYMCLCVCLLKL